MIIEKRLITDQDLTRCLYAHHKERLKGQPAGAYKREHCIVTSKIKILDKRRNGMSTDYERGYKQFAEMVGEENIELYRP